MKVGGFCNEGPGAEKGNQRGQLSGVPCGGTGALTPGRAGSPACVPLWTVRPRGRGSTSSVVLMSCSRTEYGEDGGLQPRPTLLRCSGPVGRSLPPALCWDLPVLPCGGKLIWKEGLGRKIR